MTANPRGRRPVQEITEPQRRTLKEIRLFTNRRGFPPTMKELADVLGISHASVHGQVNQLVRKGYLKREPRKARGIAIIREPEDDIPDLVADPIIGRVAAGQPILVLVYEPTIGEIRMHACGKGEKDLVRRQFGRHVFNNGDCFPETGKYALEPL